MKKHLRIALLATTALWPVKAHAEPISILIGAIASAAGGALTALGAGVLGGALAGLGTFSAAAFGAGFALAGGVIGSALIKIGLSVGLSLLAEALRPKPQQPDPGQRMVNYRQPITYMERVYGRTRKGGPIAFWQAKDGARFYEVIYAAHEVHDFVAFFADDRELVRDGAGVVTSSPYGGKLQIVGQNGGSGNVAPPLLTANFTEVTAAHDFAGLAHATVKARNVSSKRFTEVYPTGREPQVTALIEGTLVYDPRLDATVWSNNAALVIADWIVSSDGLGRSVDWDAVAIEADAADVTVTDRLGNAQAKWTLNGSYFLNEPRENVRAQMGVACDAFFFERADGKVGFHVGRFIEPDVTIRDRHILAAQYTSGLDGTAPVNAMMVQYAEPLLGYIEAPSAAITADAPDEPYEEDSLAVYWIQSHNQACRVAKRLLRTVRAEWKAALTLTMQGARLQGKRFFTLDHDEMGLTSVMEIDRLERNEDGITYSVECHSVTAEDFAFTAATEEPVRPKRTSIESDSVIPDPTGVTASGVSGGMQVNFDAPPRDSLSIVIRVREHAGPGQWSEFAAPAGQTQITIAGLPLTLHDVQVQHVSGSGRGSNFVPKDGGGNPTLTATPGSPVPAATEPASFAVTGGAGQATLNWTTANDINVAGTLFRRNTANSESGATLLGIVYSGANASLSTIDTPLAAGTYYYFARAINSAGVESAGVKTSGAVTVT